MVADTGQMVGASVTSEHAAAPSVVAPLAQGGLLGGLLGDVVKGVGKALGRAVGWPKDKYGKGDGKGKYVEEGTVWESFTHEELYEMVCGADAKPAQVETLAADWRQEGAEIRQEADQLQASVVNLMQYWRGDSADQAAFSVIDTVGWVSSVGETATAMSPSLQYASHALAAAQAAMPPPPSMSGLEATPGDRATAGEATGGSLGGALGGVSGGMDSSFDNAAAQNDLKMQAVEIMQRYEMAAVDVDTTTPQFVDSGVSDAGRAAYTAQQKPVAVSPVVPGGAGGGDGGPASTGPSGSAGSGSGSGTGSGAGMGPGYGTGSRFGSSRYGGSSWQSMTGRGIPGGVFNGTPFGGAAPGSGVGAGGPFGGGLGGGFAGGGAGGVGAGAGFGGAGGGVGAAAGAGAAGAPMRGGMPMAPMMGAGAGGAGQGQEHQRRYPFESEQVFKVDRDVAPGVIGQS